jgi:hypothetical protein
MQQDVRLVEGKLQGHLSKHQLATLLALLNKQNSGQADLRGSV